MVIVALELRCVGRLIGLKPLVILSHSVLGHTSPCLLQLFIHRVHHQMCNKRMIFPQESLGYLNLMRNCCKSASESWEIYHTRLALGLISASLKRRDNSLSIHPLIVRFHDHDDPTSSELLHKATVLETSTGRH